MMPAMLRIVVVFPAPFGPDQAEHLAGLHLEGEPADRREIAVELLEPLDLDHGDSVAGGDCRWGARG